MNNPQHNNIKLTSFSHGGGCGCKISPGVLAEILKNSSGFPLPEKLLVGIETADDAAVYKLNDEQALIATTDFFMPIVDDPYRHEHPDRRGAQGSRHLFNPAVNCVKPQPDGAHHQRKCHHGCRLKQYDGVWCSIILCITFEWCTE